MTRLESPALPGGKIQIAGALFAGLLIAIAAALLIYQARLTRDPRAPEAAPPGVPRDQAAFEAGDLIRDLRDRQKKNLLGYRRDPADPGFVRVPIERAMQALIEAPSPDSAGLFSTSKPGGR